MNTINESYAELKIIEDEIILIEEKINEEKSRMPIHRGDQHEFERDCKVWDLNHKTYYRMLQDQMYDLRAIRLIIREPLLHHVVNKYKPMIKTQPSEK